jgi:hypothetical protein
MLMRSGAAPLLPGMPPSVLSKTTNDRFLQALRETGATGLEPATSGVTAQQATTGYDPELLTRAGIPRRPNRL